MKYLTYGIQRHLFPFLEEELGPLTEFHRKLTGILEVVRIEDGILDGLFPTGKRWDVRLWRKR